MGMACTVCTSPKRAAIDVELVGGQAMAAIAKRYNLGEDSVRRHRAAHLSPALTKVALSRRSDETAALAFDANTARLESLLGRLEALLGVAEERRSLIGAANLAREIRGAIELMCRLTGALDERPQNVTVNVLATPEFTGIVGRLIEALTPYPEARIAAAAVLDVKEVGP
jgi:hypothetical protein